MVRAVEELHVYQKALAASDAVSAILKRPAFVQDHHLRRQLASASERVAADLAEGFAQDTNRQFGAFVTDARGSNAEARVHLHAARTRGYITAAECDRLTADFDEIERMLTGLGKHLRKEDRRERGYGIANRRRRRS
jgi:four helix bundle protein